MRLSWVILVCLLGIAPAPLWAQFELGSEFQVNTYTPGAQSYAEVASNAEGDSVVIWTDGSPFAADLMGQRYTSGGARAGSEFQVNVTTAFPIGHQSVAVGDDGSFVVAWTAALFATPGLTEVFARRYASNGAALGAEFQVNTFTPNYQAYPRVARDAAGDFVVVWLSLAQDGDLSGLFGRRFASSGTALGSEFQINTYTAGAQMSVALAGGAAGDFVVVWESVNQDHSLSGIFGQRFASDGARLGSEFQVNTYTLGAQQDPAVARDEAGNFVIVWTSFAQDGDDDGVVGRRFASSGAASGTEFVINSMTLGRQANPDVASAADGAFLVTWDDGGDSLSGEVFGRRFTSNGVAAGSDFRINTYMPAGQFLPAVASAASGEVVCVWSSATQDGDEIGVFGKRLAIECPAAPIAAGCRSAGKSLLLLKDKSDDTTDKLLWKWLKGAATDVTELGDPTATTGYTLCVYDAAGLALAADVGPGPSWSATGSSGFTFKDVESPGIAVVKLKAGADGKPKALVKGKGSDLPDPTIPLALPVRVQLLNSNGACWESIYGTTIKNEPGQFKAKF